jgi:hypothetical protein
MPAEVAALEHIPIVLVHIYLYIIFGLKNIIKIKKKVSK